MSKIKYEEIRNIDKIKNWFTDVDLYKWALGLSGACIAFFSKISWNYLNNRNNKLDDLCKRVGKIERNFLVSRSDGKTMTLNKCVVEIIHKLDNHEIGESSALQLILDEIKELRNEKKNR